MNKKLAIIVSIVLVLCVIGGVAIYFAWQSASKTITDIQDQIGVSPTIETSLDDTGSTASDSSVCSVLSLDVAKEILGADAKLASENPNNCTYSLVNAETSSFGVLTMIVTKTNAITARSNFEEAKIAAYSNQIEQVTGLNADDAYFATTLKQLSILKGDSWIIISGISDNFTSEKELAIETAKLVL